MDLKKRRISPQYLRTDEIEVTIIEMKSPSHFVIKEYPSVKLSSEAKKFVEAEESMQKYYHSIEQSFFPLPLKDSMIVVLSRKKFYRAQVRSILNSCSGHLINVNLLDYGQECSVERNCIFEIHPDFLSHPYQAADFKLHDVEPISLVMSSVDMDLAFGPVDSWDPSSIQFVEEMRKAMTGSHIIVKGINKECLFGSLYVSFHSGESKCVNEELISKKFAGLKTNIWDGVTKIEDCLSIPFRRDIRQPIAYRSSDECTTSPQESPFTTPTKSEKDISSDPLKKLMKMKNLEIQSSNQIQKPTELVDVTDKKSNISDEVCNSAKENNLSGAANNNCAAYENETKTKEHKNDAIAGKGRLQKLLQWAQQTPPPSITQPLSDKSFGSPVSSPQKESSPKTELLETNLQESTSGISENRSSMDSIPGTSSRSDTPDSGFSESGFGNPTGNGFYWRSHGFGNMSSTSNLLPEVAQVYSAERPFPSQRQNENKRHMFSGTPGRGYPSDEDSAHMLKKVEKEEERESKILVEISPKMNLYEGESAVKDFVFNLLWSSGEKHLFETIWNLLLNTGEDDPLVFFEWSEDFIFFVNNANHINNFNNTVAAIGPVNLQHYYTSTIFKDALLDQLIIPGVQRVLGSRICFRCNTTASYGDLRLTMGVKACHQWLQSLTGNPPGLLCQVYVSSKTDSLTAVIPGGFPNAVW